MNTRIVGLGVILLIIAVPLGIYTNQTMLVSGQPGAVSAVHENPTQPYATEALVLGAVGVALVIAGLVMRKRTNQNDEREGSLGVDESEVRFPAPPPPPP
ncbi:MAG TPA: hypothetical protein VGS04_06115 [Nitrososphaerales archaeon]|nr:hypothetical protein [Nitrososphaerales archaeon]